MAQFDSGRRFRVGASEVAAILGADPYRTASDVWDAKVNGTPFVENEHVVRGKALESGVLDWYEIISGNKLRRAAVREGAFSADPRQVSLVHPCGWAAATLDGLTEDGRLVVEAKVPASGKAWREPDVHPFQYRIQVVWQLGVAAACGLPVESGELIAGPIWGKLQRHPIQPDPEFFRLALVKAGEFIEFVKRGEPLPASFGGTTEAA